MNDLFYDFIILVELHNNLSGGSKVFNFLILKRLEILAERINQLLILLIESLELPYGIPLHDVDLLRLVIIVKPHAGFLSHLLIFLHFVVFYDLIKVFHLLL